MDMTILAVELANMSGCTIQVVIIKSLSKALCKLGRKDALFFEFKGSSFFNISTRVTSSCQTFSNFARLCLDCSSVMIAVVTKKHNYSREKKNK